MTHLTPKDLPLRTRSPRRGWPQPHSLLLEAWTRISRVAEKEDGHTHSSSTSASLTALFSSVYHTTSQTTAKTTPQNYVLPTNAPNQTETL